MPEVAPDRGRVSCGSVGAAGRSNATDDRLTVAKPGAHPPWYPAGGAGSATGFESRDPLLDLNLRRPI